MGQVLEVRKMKCSYFKSVWNILDILVIGIATLCIAFSVYRTNSVDDKLESLLKGKVVLSESLLKSEVVLSESLLKGEVALLES